MEAATRERRTPRRMMAILATVGLVAAMLAFVAPGAGAVPNKTKCQAQNLTTGAKASPGLQSLIDAASAGDTIQVKGICVGNFSITEDLILQGKATKDVAEPTLDANESGRPLTITGDAAGVQVVANDLSFTGGSVDPHGGGIIVSGADLTLNDSSVHDNTSTFQGGGIYGIPHEVSPGDFAIARLTLNDTSVYDNASLFGSGGGVAILGFFGGRFTMNGTSSVHDNTAPSDGGGVVFGGATVSEHFMTMNDSSSVSGNTAGRNGGGIAAFGHLTMNDSSSVSGNTAADGGGGIFLLEGSAALNDSSSVSGNTANGEFFAGGGILHQHGTTVTLNDSSSVSGNIPDDIVQF